MQALLSMLMRGMPAVEGEAGLNVGAGDAVADEDMEPLLQRLMDQYACSFLYAYAHMIICLYIYMYVYSCTFVRFPHDIVCI